MLKTWNTQNIPQGDGTILQFINRFGLQPEFFKDQKDEIGGGRLNPFCRDGYEQRYGDFDGSLNSTNS